MPLEYLAILTYILARYNSIVKGPRASTNMVVVIYKDGLESMLRHAIIRTT